ASSRWSASCWPPPPSGCCSPTRSPSRQRSTRAKFPLLSGSSRRSYSTRSQGCSNICKAHGSRLEQRSFQKSCKHPAVDELERRFPGAVVTAPENRNVMRDGALPKCADEVFRQIEREGEIVPRVHEQRLPVAQALEIPLRADRFPEVP